MKKYLFLAAIGCLLSSCFDEYVPVLATDENDGDEINLCHEFITLDFEPFENTVQVIPYRIHPKQSAQNALLNATYDFDYYTLKMWSDSLDLLYWDAELEVMSEYTDLYQIGKEEDTIILDFTEQMNDVIDDYEQIIVEGIAILCY